jgi:hypothetical protein
MSIGLEHQEARGLGKPRDETAGIEDFAAGDAEAHRRRTVLSGSDRERGPSRAPLRRRDRSSLRLERGYCACKTRVTKSSDVQRDKASESGALLLVKFV